MWRLVAMMSFVMLIVQADEARCEELCVCGWDEVFVLELSGRSPQKSWSWRATGRPELPEEFRELFGTTDECKPLEGGRKLLISSSGGGVALVERPSGRVLWYGYVGNAHSIELLPHERVVVAGSTNENGQRLVVFDLAKPAEQLTTQELYSGHGVIWDDQRGLLWALGFKDLNAYRLVDWATPNPKLELVEVSELPEPGGHDLYPWPGTSNLIVTTSTKVFLFERDRREFSFYPELKERARVKGVAVHPVTGRVAYVQADGENWWSTRINFLNPEGSVPLPGERIYKARWVVP